MAVLVHPHEALDKGGLYSSCANHRQPCARPHERQDTLEEGGHLLQLPVDKGPQRLQSQFRRMQAALVPGRLDLPHDIGKLRNRLKGPVPPLPIHKARRNAQSAQWIIVLAISVDDPSQLLDRRLAQPLRGARPAAASGPQIQRHIRERRQHAEHLGIGLLEDGAEFHHDARKLTAGERIGHVPERPRQQSFKPRVGTQIFEGRSCCRIAPLHGAGGDDGAGAVAGQLPQQLRRVGAAPEGGVHVDPSHARGENRAHRLPHHRRTRRMHAAAPAGDLCEDRRDLRRRVVVDRQACNPCLGPARIYSPSVDRASAGICAAPAGRRGADRAGSSAAQAGAGDGAAAEAARGSVRASERLRGHLGDTMCATAGPPSDITCQGLRHTLGRLPTVVMGKYLRC
mmetsp:Transcript_4658/g.17539  ORF Transcript_4658/g.17539 Transcript_4658/m.17539 type:complete len:398 (-) Transcript_4658:50-1243(-)